MGPVGQGPSWSASLCRRDHQASLTGVSDRNMVRSDQMFASACHTGQVPGKGWVAKQAPSGFDRTRQGGKTRPQKARTSESPRAPEGIPKALILTAAIAVLVFVGASIYVVREHGWKALVSLGPAAAPSGSHVTVPDRPKMTPPPLPGGDASVSAEPLKLLLVRTEVGRKPRDSLAFIGTSPRNPQTYQVGSLLSNGARVKSIAPDHVILERNGRTARLNVMADLRLAEAQLKGKAGAIDSVGGPQPRGPELAVSQERVTDVIRPHPVYDAQGRFVAYELQPGADPSTFARLGFEAGDRMVAADGQTLISPEQGAAALQVVAAGGTIKASVQRGGEVRTLRIDGGLIPVASPSGDEAGGSDSTQ